jgi:glycosyltransferase involved in cell wall biosynthesis
MSQASPVTLLMTAYNAERTIEESIRSIISQTYTGWSMLVIDDGSTDRTAAICARVAAEDDRITFLPSPHIGLSAAVNLGLSRIRSPYVARLDSDDIAYPERLAKQMAYLTAHPDVKVLATFGARINNKGKRLTRLGEGPTTIGEYIEHRNKRQIFFVLNSSVVAERDILLKYGEYCPDDYPADDTALYTRIAQDHPVLTLPEELVGYRISPGGVTSTNLWRMIQQWARFEYNLQHNVWIDFETFQGILNRDPVKKLQLRRGLLHKRAIRHGAYHFFNERPVLGISYLMWGALLCPFQSFRRVVRWY